MKRKYFHSIIICLLFIIALLNYLDRSTLSIANTEISLAFNISPAEMGILLSAFMWPYAIISLPAGYLVDRYNVHKIMIISMILWSFACILGGLTIGFYSILATRLLLGAAEAPFFIIATKIIQQHFPTKKRGLMSSIVNLGPRVATVIAPVSIVALILFTGWRGMFILLGSLGILIAFIWYKINKRFTNINNHKKQIKSSNPIRLKQAFSNKNVKLLCLGNFSSSYAYWLFLTWLPYYFITAKELNLSEMGIATSASFMLSLLSVMLGGILSDLLIKKKMCPIKARLFPIILGCIIAGLSMLLIPFIQNIYLIITLISISVFALGLRISPTWALVADMSCKNSVGLIGGIQNFANFTGGALAPLVTGVILVHTNNNFNLVFVISAIICLVGTTSYFFITKENSLKNIN
ncbi:MFS transporter [Pseudofrancisella aestuarii]|uniref:MFS transporter n=1 Tax=Pseudofrancisella aestuarii TaxID=2670347 RepID=A0ABV9TD85_9GAMM